MKFRHTLILGAISGAALTVAVIKFIPPQSSLAKFLDRSLKNQTVAQAPVAAPTDAVSEEMKLAQEREVLIDKLSSNLDVQIERLMRDAALQQPVLRALEREVILELWAKKAPQASLDAIYQAPRFQGRFWALGFGVAEIARNDQAAASLWLVNNVVDIDRNEAAEHAVSLLVKDVPAQAFAFAKGSGYQVEARYFDHIFENWAAKDLRGALLGFRTMDEAGQLRVVSTLTRVWAMNDFSAALSWTQLKQGTELGDQALIGVVEAGLKSAHPQVGELLKQLPDKVAITLVNSAMLDVEVAKKILPFLSARFRSRALQVIATEAFDRNPDEAVTLVKEEPLEQRAMALQRCFQNWIRTDRKAAMTWLRMLSDVPLKAALLAQVEQKKTALVPVDAVLALAGSEASPQNISQFSAALFAMAEPQPQVAAQHITNNPALVNTSAARIVASEYFLSDEASAAAWLTTLQVGDVKDAVLFSAATFWINKGEMEFASQAMASMQNPAVRTEAQVQIYKKMLDQGPEGAEKWLEAQPISDEVRAVLRVTAKRMLW